MKYAPGVRPLLLRDVHLWSIAWFHLLLLFYYLDKSLSLVRWSYIHLLAILRHRASCDDYTFVGQQRAEFGVTEWFARIFVGYDALDEGFDGGGRAFSPSVVATWLEKKYFSS